MKIKLGGIINYFLRPLGLEVIRRHVNAPKMLSGLKRTSGHNFGIKSVLDIGAASGSWSALALPVFPDARFLGVEPLVERVSDLVSLQDKYGRFNFAQVVAGENDDGMVPLNVANDLDGSTVDGKGGCVRDVPVRTIDSLVSEHNLEGPFLIKFDTHGYELPILRGAKRTLNSTVVIIMEVYNFEFVSQACRFHEMCTHLEDYGFRPFDLVNPTYRKIDNAFWQMDLFFARMDNQIFHKTSFQ